MKRFLFSLAMTAGASAVLHAGSFLYFNDYNIDTDRMGEALTALSGTNSVTIATSSTDFATKLSGGGYDLGIFMVQNYQAYYYPDGITALATFATAGGKAIYADWSVNNTYAALFGAEWTGGTDETVVTITDPTLAAGISGGVLNLYTPGWGVFSMGLTDSTVAHFNSGQGAIAYGTSGNSIVNGFLTDTFVDGAAGVQLYINEIQALTSETVPEAGSSLLLLSLGLTGLLALRRRRA